MLVIDCGEGVEVYPDLYEDYGIRVRLSLRTSTLSLVSFQWESKRKDKVFSIFNPLSLSVHMRFC